MAFIAQSNSFRKTAKETKESVEEADQKFAERKEILNNKKKKKKKKKKQVSGLIDEIIFTLEKCKNILEKSWESNFVVPFLYEP